MGTSAFAVPTLKALHDHIDEVLAVVTKPDRPKGRDRQMAASPVKEVAGALSYPVFQPASIREDWFVQALTDLRPDLFVVVAFGHILPGALLALPRLGTINLHASLLPKYRGPAPIQWAIINGDQESGVTTMWMDEGVDTGDILLTARASIGPEDTSDTLHDRLANIGTQRLIDTLDQLRSGRLVAIPQDNAKATNAPLLKKEDGCIDWTKDAKSLDAFIRGMNPWPGAFTFLFGKRLKVFKAKALQEASDERPGMVMGRLPGDFHIACGRGILALQEVQLESGKRLAVNAFLMGCPVPPGTRLG